MTLLWEHLPPPSLWPGFISVVVVGKWFTRVNQLSRKSHHKLQTFSHGAVPS